MINSLAALLIAASPWKPDILVRFEVGPYRPAIDEGLNGLTPYRDLFGEQPGVFLRPTIAALWNQPLGTFGLKLSAGWFYDSERSFIDDGRLPTTSPSRSGGRTSIR